MLSDTDDCYSSLDWPVSVNQELSNQVRFLINIISSFPFFGAKPVACAKFEQAELWKTMAGLSGWFFRRLSGAPDYPRPEPSPTRSLASTNAI
jgi:hypothetical protein